MRYILPIGVLVLGALFLREVRRPRYTPIPVLIGPEPLFYAPRPEPRYWDRHPPSTKV